MAQPARQFVMEMAHKLGQTLAILSLAAGALGQMGAAMGFCARLFAAAGDVFEADVRIRT